MRRWRWALRLVTRRMWFRAALFCLFAVALALASALVGHTISYEFAAQIGSKSVDGILNLLASSMLAVTTFSLTAMVQAYSVVTSNMTTAPCRTRWRPFSAASCSRSSASSRCRPASTAKRARSSSMAARCWDRLDRCHLPALDRACHPLRARIGHDRAGGAGGQAGGPAHDPAPALRRARDLRRTA